MTTTLETQNYYAELLILQYIGKPKAYANIQTVVNPVIMPQVSVQTIVFSLAPTSGAFVLSYNGNPSASIAWNASAGTIQSDLQAISGLSSVTVAGSISSLTLTITFTGVTPPALSLEVDTNTLLATATAVSIVITETDLILPLAVQDAFNLISGSNIAVGNQLDVLGKYVGVTRSGLGFTTNITLNDTDFLSLIRMAIVTNSSGSSLQTIQAFIQTFFPSEMLVFDYQTMVMSYFISSAVGSQNLLQLFITEGLLPRPMGVFINVIIYAPIIDFFSFRTYALPAYNAFPFNNYSSYNHSWPFLTYADAISA